MTGFFNFNSADKQSFGELIPHGTIAKVIMTVRPGGAGEGGWLAQSKNNPENFMLDCEFIVSAGQFAKRKLWDLFVVQGSEKAVNISRSTLRAMLESARGIDSKDESERANKARQVFGWQDFNGLEFVVKVGVEKGQNGYADKNKIMGVVTPDMKGYVEAMAGQTVAAPATAAPAQPSAPWVGHGQPAGTGAAPAAQAPAGTPAGSAAPSNVPSWAR